MPLTEFGYYFTVLNRILYNLKGFKHNFPLSFMDRLANRLV